MSALTRLTTRLGNWIREVRSVAIPPEWAEWVLGRRLAGHNVSALEGIQCTAVLACLRVLSGAIATIDFVVNEQLKDGKERRPDHPVDPIISLQPNELITSVEWRRNMVTSMLLHGCSVDQILLNARDEVIALNPLPASKVKIVDRKLKRFFKVETTGGPEELPNREVLYIPYLFEGKSLYDHVSHAVGLALSAEEFANRFFRSGGLQQLKLEADGNVPKDKKTEIQEMLQTNLKAGKIPFMDSGAKLNSLNLKFEEVQLKDTRIHQTREIARGFGVQPHLIGDLERSTNNNIEHQFLEFKVLSCKPLSRTIEQRCDTSLFGKSEMGRLSCGFDLSQLSPSDLESTAEAIAKLVAGGVLTSNDGRRRIGENPHPDGNKLMIQSGMVPSKEQQKTGGKDKPPPEQEQE